MQSPLLQEKSSFLGAFGAILKVLEVSIQTLWDARRGRLTPAVVDARARHLGEHVLGLARARITVEGAERLDPEQAYLYMSNHESLMDIPLIFATAPRPPRMVAKAELFKVPIWGPALKVAGFIPVDRKNRTQAFASLKEGGAQMGEGTSVWIAPEGTRSRDGSLLPFKKGGFMLAFQTNAKIVPVGIVGARNIVRPKSFKAYLDQEVVVRYGEPIDVASYGVDRRDELMRDVRQAIEALRAPMPAKV
ncbi:1-acyl-sn-glycerol-3-phosphate acyltransferase [bacterium]|nr:1-acyl-sn-glycerol-3-phosphate acyltransferase [bacterium]